MRFSGKVKFERISIKVCEFLIEDTGFGSGFVKISLRNFAK